MSHHWLWENDEKDQNRECNCDIALLQWLEILAFSLDHQYFHHFVLWCRNLSVVSGLNFYRTFLDVMTLEVLFKPCEKEELWIRPDNF